MDDFPKFMKNPGNRIDSKDQYSRGVEGYVFDGADGSQMAFWTCNKNTVSEEHTHEYDEYLVVIQGRYTVTQGRKKIVLQGGDEYHIPKGVGHAGEAIAGTRTVHAFGGKRASRRQNGDA
ncbi:MAG: cupin domain-containing protein [Proteobacteria bacterium]|nr:cupin domain-containing protein [Pseudomonadota bacterium]